MENLKQLEQEFLGVQINIQIDTLIVKKKLKYNVKDYFYSV